jgi:hypothetical protein
VLVELRGTPATPRREVTGSARAGVDFEASTQCLELANEFRIE